MHSYPSLSIFCLFSVLLINACSSSTNINFKKSRELKEAPEGVFSMIVIPDTQQYFGKSTKLEPDSQNELTNPVFKTQIKWINDNIDRQKVVFVSHVGDIVDINNHSQWSLARNFMNSLHGKIPYGISVGNHDMTSDGNSSLFQQYFPVSRFSEFDWYGGYFNETSSLTHSSNNSNSYQLFTAEGIDFVILHLECNAPDNVLMWADKILNKHKNRFAIITTHMFLGPVEKPSTPEGFFNDSKGIMQWIKNHGENGNSPQQMWDNLFSKHKNIHLILSGDQSRSNALNHKLIGDSGNTVYAILSDYMLSPGPLRIIRFKKDKNEIDVISYNVNDNNIIGGTKTIPEKSSHNFTIDIDFSAYLIGSRR